jgi:hypothetical protein
MPARRPLHRRTGTVAVIFCDNFIPKIGRSLHFYRLIRRAVLEILPTLSNGLFGVDLFRKWNAPFHYRLHTQVSAAR